MLHAQRLPEPLHSRMISGETFVSTTLLGVRVRERVGAELATGVDRVDASSRNLLDRGRMLPEALPRPTNHHFRSIRRTGNRGDPENLSDAWWYRSRSLA